MNTSEKLLKTGTVSNIKAGRAEWKGNALRTHRRKVGGSSPSGRATFF